MNKTWLVGIHEYKRHTFTRRFLFGLLSVPLVILLIVGLVFFIISLENKTSIVGYVDQSGLLANPLPAPTVQMPDKPLTILAYSDQASADVALEKGEIQAIFTIPADYLTSGKLAVYHVEPVKSSARGQFNDFLAVNLLAEVEPDVAARILGEDLIVIRAMDGSREIDSRNGFISIFIPILAAFGFIIAMFTTGGYLVQAVVEEKENRTMEVLLTSVSPNQFMTGKILADIAIGMTQILVWLLFIIIGVKIGGIYIEILRDIHIDPQVIVFSFVILLPTFVMVSALMAMIGATVTEAREGQQMSGLLSLPIWIPYMFIAVLLENPNSSLSVALSLLPMTSSLAMLIRQGVTNIPAWQIVISSLIMVACAIAAIWLAGRAFRLGMLRYGKRLSLREVFSRREVNP